jgi:hypothetical protein
MGLNEALKNLSKGLTEAPSGFNIMLMGPSTGYKEPTKNVDGAF